MGNGDSRRKPGLGILGPEYRGVAAALAILMANVAGFAKHRDEAATRQALTLEMQVYNYAGVEPNDMAQAGREASWVLRMAGLKTIWLDCVALEEGLRNGETCDGTGGAGRLVLRILPRAMTGHTEWGEETLGFAMPSDGYKPAFMASVFYDRVKLLSGDPACPRDVVLGYALAHEVGHLLLGTNSHSPRGIMKANWTKKELLSASAGRLTFFPKQAAKIRAEVQKRATTPRVKDEASSGMIVTIYIYAQVPRTVLSEAEAVAARIFERAGTEISWQEHRATTAGSETVASVLRTPNDVHITMHIVPRSMAVHLAPNQICLGLSVVPGGDKRGDMAYVFYNRVEELARRRSLPPADSLGHAMAHEIGHLLLGTNSHSPTGLMHARWDRSDLLRAATGWLIFSDDEGKRLRAEVRARADEARK